MKTIPFARAAFCRSFYPICCLACLLTLSTASFADWVEVEQFEDGIRVYADPASVSRTENTAMVTHLVRWAEPQVDEGLPPYRSTAVRTAYDCGDRLERYLASTAYAGPMGDGAKVMADDNAAETWYTISDASMESKLWAIACKTP